jgi:hypothetical protein
MSTIWYRFSKAANLRFWPDTVPYFLHRLASWDQISLYQTFLLLVYLPIRFRNFGTTMQYSVSQSATLRVWAPSILNWRLLYFKAWSVWLCAFPLKDVQVYLWILWCGNIVLSTIRFSCGKIYCSRPLSLLISCESSFPIEISQQNFHAVLWKFIEYTLSLVIKAAFCIITFIPSSCKLIQNNNTKLTAFFSFIL